MDNNDVEFEIRRWILEMKSGHNDGWVTGDYRDRLKKLRKLIDDALENDET